MRGPCEVCGDHGQAHHDSYYPERWLDVRWLCATHHREWHDGHEPEWPTIYEFHPSDQRAYMPADDVTVSLWPKRSGQVARPWYRKSKKCWYVSLAGQQIRLDKDRDKALEKYHTILREGSWLVRARQAEDIAAILNSQPES